MKDSGFSRGYTAGMAAVLSGLGGVAVLATGDRAAGIGAGEWLGLLAAAVLFAAAGAGDRVAPGASWPRLLAVAGVVIVLVLCFLAVGSAGMASVVFFELAAAICGVLFAVQAGRVVPTA